MAGLGAEEIQLDLIIDYRTNVALSPAFQDYLRRHRPPLLAIWEQHDHAFVPSGAYAFSRDLPDAEVHPIDVGHFALETKHGDIAARVRYLFRRKLDR